MLSEESLGTERGYYELRKLLTETLRELDALSPDELTEQRYRRFRKIGAHLGEESTL